MNLASLIMPLQITAVDGAGFPIQLLALLATAAMNLTLWLTLVAGITWIVRNVG
ncbi:hypothetical protein LCGC14_1592180 [marine sediment metagenome]|uniref:Uncharacterized protein n=1 Tax=marine sediment metagenome TaxID=412755 RepID=A0A0F9KUD2_9ZZZZ